MNKEEKIIARNKSTQRRNYQIQGTKAYGLVWENEKNISQIVEDCKKKLPILEQKITKFSRGGYYHRHL